MDCGPSAGSEIASEKNQRAIHVGKKSNLCCDLFRGPRGRPMARILIIDDDKIVRDLLRTALEDDGHEVVEAPNGKIGSRLYRDEPTNLVITDIYMPNKEGLETITELRREFRGVKIIAISEAPVGKFDPLPMAEKLGALRTFAKPLDLNEFLIAVREILGQ